MINYKQNGGILSTVTVLKDSTVFRTVTVFSGAQYTELTLYSETLILSIINHKSFDDIF